MNGKFYLLECGDNDVLSFGEDTYKVHKLKKALNQSLTSDIGAKFNDSLSHNGVTIDETILKPAGDDNDSGKWFSQGIDCEILKLGADRWKKGKVKLKINLEFYIEEQSAVETYRRNNLKLEPSEAPLTDLRQIVHQDKESQPENQ